MSKRTVKPALNALRGELTPPPDKSISHRAVLLSSISRGTGVIKNFLRSEDTVSTLNAFRSMGVRADDREDEISITGVGLRGLKEPPGSIDCGNSGTTMRLLSGVLAGSAFRSELTGDESLSARPMGRIIKPLRMMGADITARGEDRYPPLVITGGALRAISYEMPVASAQVKSAVLLAGLYARGTTEVIEPVRSRDHTERMLPHFGVSIHVDGMKISLEGGQEPVAADTVVPGDFSSAAFFVVAALTVPGSEVLIKGVGLNPLRTGLLGVLESMGAEVEVRPTGGAQGEPVGDIYVRNSGAGLRAVDVTGEMVPALIDEFPVLCIAAARASGVTRISGAGELRVKESDRISAVAEGLRAMGVEVEEFPDGMSIRGTEALKGAEVSSRGDHRVAMAFSVAALSARGETVIDGAEAVGVSFPGFFETLKGLGGGKRGRGG